MCIACPSAFHGCKGSHLRRFGIESCVCHEGISIILRCPRYLARVRVRGVGVCPSVMAGLEGVEAHSVMDCTGGSSASSFRVRIRGTGGKCPCGFREDSRCTRHNDPDASHAGTLRRTPCTCPYACRGSRRCDRFSMFRLPAADIRIHPVGPRTSRDLAPWLPRG